MTDRTQLPPATADSRPERKVARRLGLLLLGVAGALVLAVGWDRLLALRTGPVYEGAPLSEWLRRASSRNLDQRRQAARVLDQVGPEAVPTLIRALEARATWWWHLWQAMRGNVLGAPRGPDASAALNRTAAEVLARLGPAASNAAPALLRWGARHGYASLDHHPLRAIGPAAAPALRRALHSREARLRETAAEVVADPVFQPVADQLIPPLLAGAVHRSGAFSRAHLQALGVLGPPRRDVAARLAEWLPACPADSATALLNALAAFGPEARDYADRVRPFLTAPEPRVRLAAARALHAAQPPARETVPVLIELLREPALQWEAALQLGLLGEAATPAIPALLAALEHTPTHRPSRTPHFAALALGHLGPEAVAGLVKLLEHPSADVRMSAAAALEEHGAAAAAAVPALTRMLGAADPEEQMVAARVLGSLGRVAAPALPELTRLSQTETTQDVIVGHARSAARLAVQQIQRALTPAGPDPRGHPRGVPMPATEPVGHENHTASGQ